MGVLREQFAYCLEVFLGMRGDNLQTTCRGLHDLRFTARGMARQGQMKIRSPNAKSQLQNLPFSAVSEACSPSPLPSPSGRGRTTFALRQLEAALIFECAADNAPSA